MEGTRSVVDLTQLELQAKQLYNAALEGDISSLLNLLQEDPRILDRCILENSALFMQSPLHVAANFGHLEFTKVILSRKTEMAEEFDRFKGSSPLHLASRKGHIEIVKALRDVEPNMCFAHDKDGNNPFHLAAIKGQVDVLNALFEAKSQAAWERTANKNAETVLHLCVKYNQFNALKCLVDITKDDKLLNSKNKDGNTVLHLAVAAKQTEMVRYLLDQKHIAPNVTNKNGLTARDLYKQNMGDKELRTLFRLAKAKLAKDIHTPDPKTLELWFENQRTALMVVSSLIATMAFQVGMNPPGGVWQDDQPNLNPFNNTNPGQSQTFNFSHPFEHKSLHYNFSHIAGSSVMAYMNRGRYEFFLIANTIALVSSLSVILLLISGIPPKRWFVGLLMVVMWLSVGATALTYVVSVGFLSLYSKLHQDPASDYPTLEALLITVLSWLGVMLILLIGHVPRIIRMFNKIIEALSRAQLKFRRKNKSTKPKTSFELKTANYDRC